MVSLKLQQEDGGVGKMETVQESGEKLKFEVARGN